FNRMLSGLTPKQQDYLRLFPLLFHVNHPMLPGYFDSFTPCGIPNYSPTNLEKQIVKTISQSFDYQSKAHRFFSISSLFLMGSMGTLGQSISSDIDLWICLANELNEELSQKLNNKAENIKIWFAEQGIELNFYLVNQKDFSQKNIKLLDSENCGNTQRFLLLDEFYRTAVWLVGRKPLWWLVPESENYSEFSNRLIAQKHLDQHDWIDFGEVRSIPASEYFTAALWQLYKSINSPYKSFVKLMALEVYAQNFPCGGILSSQLKSILHSNQQSTTECDPYLLVLKFSESALSNSPQKLDFLRRAFYLKSGLKVKLNIQYEKNKSWRYKLMQSLVIEWGWSDATLARLNNRPNWKINNVAEQRKDLIRELTSSYYNLSNFARVQGVMNKNIKQELTQLGRQLYASFERRNGKIDSLNNGIANDVTENTLTLSNKNNSWSVFQDQIPENQILINEPIFNATSLFDCLTWGCINNVIDKNTHFHLYTSNSYFDQNYAKQTSREILGWIRSEQNKQTNFNFKEQAKTMSLGIFINTGVDPLLNEKDRDRYLIADNLDCLSLSAEKTNLAYSFHTLTLNSWGEVDLDYFEGDSAIPEFFQKYRDLIISLYTNDEPSYFCHGLLQNKAIVERFSYLLKQWVKLSAHSKKSNCTNFYLMCIGKKYLSICIDEQMIQYKLLTDKEKLLNSVKLAKVDGGNSIKLRTQVDQYLPLRPIEQSVLSRRASKNHQCFINEISNQTIELIFKSSLGAIHARRHKDVNLKQIIAHYQQFFMKAANRIDDVKTLEVDYFRCDTKRTNSTFKLKTNEGVSNGQNIKLTLIKNIELNMNNFKLVQAIKIRNNDNPLAFNFYSNDKDYLFEIDKESTYSSLVQDILAERKNKAHYPIYITDLDLGKNRQEVNIVELLNVKRDLENRLNLIMSKLS
ncbi:MAG: class I adenylate cyclase, partial [Kangiellaceae bacterium]